MNFKEWFINEEIYPQNKTAIVFHRTKGIENISNILNYEFKVGGGCLYGCGLYTTFAIESQFTENMNTYGPFIIKFKATNLDEYLIFQANVAKAIHGQSYKISDQLKKLGIYEKVIDAQKYDKMQENASFTGGLAKSFYEKNKWIEHSVKGIIYRGQNDGYCLLKYNPVNDGTISMLGFAEAKPEDKQKMEELKFNKGWTTSTDKASIKSIYSSPEKKSFYDVKKSKSNYSYFDLKNKEFTDQEVFQILSNARNISAVARILGSKNINKLSDNNVFDLLYYASNKEEMAKLILQYKTEFSDDNVYSLLLHVDDKDEMARILGSKNIDKLSDDNVYRLLKYANDKDEMVKLIIQYKKELSDSNVRDLLSYASNKEEMVKLILQYKKELSDDNVDHLLYFASNKDEMVKLILQYKKELSDDNIDHLLDYASNKDEMVKLLGSENINKLSDSNVRDLLHYASNKEEMEEIAKLLGPENINKLSHDNVRDLLDVAPSKGEKGEIARVIDRFMTNKKPEIQSLLSSYLSIYHWS